MTDSPQSVPDLTVAEIVDCLVDWKDAPLPEVLSTLSDLKRAYDKAAAIVVTRQQKSPPKVFCWVWENREHGLDGGPIPKSVVEACRKIIPNGKWAFRDDGNYVTKKGIQIREPVMCCSPRCTDIYMRWRNDKKAKRLGAATATESGIEIRQ